jgi:uncharacterized protein
MVGIGRMRMAAILLGAAVPLAACTTQVTESTFLRPVAGGTLTEAALREAAPMYTLAHHSIPPADGAQLHAVHLTQPGARGTILYFGGNGYTIERFGARTAAALAPLGMDLMIVDHRGYGLSEGKPTAALIESDGLAAFDYLGRLPRVGSDRIVVHGQSLGSFIAGHVAANRSTRAVVLESSVTSTEEWVSAQARAAGAAGALVTVKLAESLKGRGNLRNMPLIDEPLLLMVGANDKTTPPRFSESLYQASPLPAGRKMLVVVNGAGHNDALAQPEAIAAYRRFLDGLFVN